MMKFLEFRVAAVLLVWGPAAAFFAGYPSSLAAFQTGSGITAPVKSAVGNEPKRSAEETWPIRQVPAERVLEVGRPAGQPSQGAGKGPEPEMAVESEKRGKAGKDAETARAPGENAETGSSPEGAKGPEGGRSAEAAKSPAGGELQRGISVTRHFFQGRDSSFEYTATAGYLRIMGQPEKSSADIFFTAYTAGEGKPDSRPVTFLFNGGPGASSVWLHLGVAGPVRVVTGAENPPAPPPYDTVANPWSWLPWTDLVFIDPVGTGFSQAVPAGDAKRFYNTREDVRSIGEFIRLYTSLFGRWRSPKCLAGESYGAIRAAGLLRYLYDSFGMEIDGVVMISPALELDTIQPGSSNDLPYFLFLPSYAAAAWYHGKIGPEFRGDLQKALMEAQKWAIDEYLPALARGNSLTEAEKEKIAAGFSKFTGLPATLVRNQDLRISRQDFTAELLRPEGLSLGFMDARSTRRAKGAGGSFLDDPGMAMTLGPYSGAINAYLADYLKVAPGPAYVTFSEEANSQWNWTPTDALGSIRRSMNRNRRMKLLVAAGYFDLDIPYFSSTYLMSRLNIDPELRSNVTMHFFTGGHMFYTGNSALSDFSGEAGRFFDSLKQAPAGTGDKCERERK